MTEISEKTAGQVKTLKDLETKYVLSQNTILNSSGKYEFQGWKITANFGINGISKIEADFLQRNYVL